MPPHTLRAATSEDAEFLYSVAEVHFRSLVESQGKRWAVQRMREKCMQDASSPSTSIIQVGGADAGFLKFEVEATAVMIDALLLLPEYQGRGVGSLMLDRVLAQARAAALPVRLSVYTANPARAFWEKHGFKVKGEVDQHTQMERET